MEFTTFKYAVKREVESRVGKDCTVILNDAAKNNGVIISGLTIQNKSSNIAPVIYLNGYYQAYESGGAEFKEIINNILMVYEKNKFDQRIDMRQFQNYKNIRKKIVYKLINTEKNRKLLQEIPHITFHDLSIVFQVMVDKLDLGNATILIRNEHLGIWNISLDKIYKDACHNTPIINRYEIHDLKDVIGPFIPQEAIKQIPASMYMLSNQACIHGAACMIYPNVLKHISDMLDSNIYILPSSIHEVILLPSENANEPEYEYIKCMIREVNDTQVDEEEILSYSAYYYDRNIDEIIKL
ncbi:MAG: hypothetical protein J1E98_00445 [Lachnospiraceae bacterium]|nr:hypothetical protein [Lachnospiraceae bacterium]